MGKRKAADGDGDCDGSDRKSRFKCGFCGSEFRSEKALHGHMRSHPERNWRGMNPPVSAAAAAAAVAATGSFSSSSSSGGVDHEVRDRDCYSPLLTWSTTACRGRRPIGSSSSASSGVVDATDTGKENTDALLRNEYPCDFCGKAFASPQALGGHKSSCPCKPRKNGPQEAKLVRFDLNELPPEDGEA
ncbi:Zinc finger protein ZAT3, partial [Cucurbita argyrosperma subsp. sororia]